MLAVSIESLEGRLFLSTTPVIGTDPKSASAPAIHAANTDDVLATDPDKSRLASTGRNKYWALVPGFKAKFFGIDEEGSHVRLTITVTNQTKVVDGVKTRVVKEVETTDGEVDEISLNYFAIHRDTKTVYYFGEDSSIIENGKVVSTEGSWLSGVDGAKFGIVMPGKVQVGQHFFQERAPGVAQDEAEIIDTGEKFKTKHFNFSNTIVTRETSALEPGVEEFKRYAPGVGIVVDDFLTLTAYSGL